MSKVGCPRRSLSLSRIFASRQARSPAKSVDELLGIYRNDGPLAPGRQGASPLGRWP